MITKTEWEWILSYLMVNVYNDVIETRLVTYRLDRLR